MLKKTEIQENMDEVLLLYEGTEVLSPEEIFKLTEGHPLEVIAKGSNLKVTLYLVPMRLHCSKLQLTARAHIEIIEHEPEE